MKFQPAPLQRSIRLPALPFGLPGLLAILLGLLTIALYWPVTSNDFVNLDDNLYVQSNVQVQQGLTWENLKWAFTHVVSGNWHPLTMLSHMLDCQLYGLKPWGHHLTSLLFHAADSALLLLLLQRLTGAVWRSLFVAALFAVHPLHVESVAWVAERKDVLSAFFGFLTLLFYVRYVRANTPANTESEPAQSGVSFHRSRDYWLACFCFALGLLSKPMLVTWPFVLLLLDYWPLGRFQPGHLRPLVWEKIPFFCLALASCAATFLAQKLAGAVQSLDLLPLATRLENAGISYCRYVLKIVWPADLAVYYPYPRYWPLPWVLLAVIVLAGCTLLLWSRRRRHPYALMGWLWFVGTLVPVIGVIQVGAQSLADRYTYIPSVGLFILICWGTHALTRRWPHRAMTLSVAGAAVIILFAGATRRQIGCWKNSVTLYRHTIAITTGNPLPHNNLASVYVEQGQTNAAIAEYQEVLRINSNLASPHLNLGNLLAMQGLTNQALGELQKAVQLEPANDHARCCYGRLLLKSGQTDAGISQYMAAVHFQTNDPASRSALANLLVESGLIAAAIDQLQSAIQMTPANPELHYQLGNLLLGRGQYDDAIAQFRETIRLKPDSFEAHNNLASLLSKKGPLDQAIGDFQESIRLKPDDADPHYNLGALYLKQGRADEAAAEFQTVVRLAPKYAPARYYLGTILIRKGQADAAITQLQEAIRLKPDYALAHNKLGIALGSAGHLNEAIAEFQAAIRLNPDYAEANTNLAIALKMQAAAGH
ncbi:MAG: tetratricopeptide repeat protein [Verrucomicrobiae bacterium]|nr:tetratricopeptide repeat protein [Verrucomicrobiae bacterium]